MMLNYKLMTLNYKLMTLQTNDPNSANTGVDNIDDVNIDDITKKYQSHP